MKQRKLSNYPVITAEFENLEELAEVMECCKKTAARVLNGSRPFTHKEKVRVSNYLEKTIAEVFGE